MKRLGVGLRGVIIQKTPAAGSAHSNGFLQSTQPRGEEINSMLFPSDALVRARTDPSKQLSAGRCGAQFTAKNLVIVERRRCARGYALWLTRSNRRDDEALRGESIWGRV